MRIPVVGPGAGQQQAAQQHLVAGGGRQVQRRRQRRVLHARVHVHLHRQQEHHALHVARLDGHVQEVAAFFVYLY